jgi:long-chain fatty acid transport protein
MSYSVRITLRIAVAALTVTLPAGAFATTGYVAHGQGVKYRGLAGAGAALHLSALAAATNPGAMVFVGDRYDVDIGLFSPHRKYTVTGGPSGQPVSDLAPGEEESTNNYFVIPAAGANHMFQDQTMSIGVALYANGGINTDWQTETFNGAGPTGVDLYRLFLAASFGVKFHERHGFGVTPIFAWQRFFAKGLHQFAAFSDDPDKLTNNGYDDSFGFGFRVGYLGKVHSMVSVGASYQSRIWMSELDEYAGLLAEKGDFDVPPSWAVGIACFPLSGVTVALDVNQIRYEEIKSIHNPLLPNLTESRLGEPEGAAFGWRNVMIYKLGLALEGPETFTWRLGYSYNDQPIPEQEVFLNILLPYVQQHHITGGVTKLIQDRHEISLSLMYSPAGTLTGPNALNPQQTIELEMSQWEITIGYGYR